MARSLVNSFKILGGAGFALCLVAQEAPKPATAPAEIDELMALLNTPIEGASKRKQKSIESPQAIEVLTADQIRASGVFRLIDVLKLMTNVQVYEFGRDRANLSIRSTVVNANMRNVQLLVDGVPMFNTESQAIDFGLIPVPTDAIERVEVVRGPSSSLYGANAQVGVIAITTRKAKEGSTGSVRGGAGLTRKAEVTGAFNTQGFYSYGSSRFNLAAGFAGNSHRDTGISERVLGGTRLVDPQDQGHGSQVFLRPEAVIGEGRVWALYSKAANRIGPQVVENPANLAKLYQFAFAGSTAETAQIGWSQPWTSAFRTELKINRAHLIPLNAAPMQVVPGSPTSAGTVPLLQTLDPGLKGEYDILDTTLEQVVLQGNWDPSETLHFVFGVDSSRMKAVKAPLVGIQADRQDSATGGFASVDWTVGAATLSLGARIENETLGGSRVSPRAAVVYALPEGSILRAGYYTSSRSPQVSEVMQDIRVPGRPAPIGNPDVKPEEFDNVELGYRKNWAAWSLDVTAYQMKLKKVISPQPTGVIVGGFPQTQFRNSGTSLTNKGLEISLKGELGKGWLLGFNTATVDFKDETGVQESYSPKLTANLWTRYQIQKFQGYLALQHVGAYALTNQSNITGPREDTSAQLQVHFNLSYEVLPGFQVGLYGINAARAYQDSAAGSTNNAHLIRFSRREAGIQAGYRF